MSITDHRSPETGDRARAKPLSRPAIVIMAWAMFASTWLVLSLPVAAGQDFGTSTIVTQTLWTDGTTPFGVTAETTVMATTARLVLHEPLTNRSRFGASLRNGAELGPVMFSTEPIRIDEPPVPGEPSLVDLELAGQATGVGLGPGVYPLEVQFLDESGEPIDIIVTHIVRVSPPVEAPINVAIVVPIEADQPLAPTGRTSIDSGELEEISALLEVVERHPTSGVILAPDPETLYALSEGNTVALGVLDTMRTLARRHVTLTRPFADINPRTWVRAGHAPEIGLQWEAGAAQIVSALGTEVERRWWIGAEPPDPETASVLVGLGINHLTAPEQTLEPLDGDAFPVTLMEPFTISASTGHMTAFALDDGLRETLESTIDPMLAAQRLVADLSVLYYDRPSHHRRGAVLLPPSGPSWNAEVLDLLLGALRDHPLIDVVGLDTLAAVTSPARENGTDAGSGPVLQRRVRTRPVDDLASFPSELAEARGVIDSYGSVIGPDRPELLPLRVSSLAAASHRLGPQERNRYITEIGETVATSLDGQVELPVERRITITSRDSVIPLTIRAPDTDHRLNVLVRLASDKLAFPDGADEHIALGGDGPDSVRLDIAVTALSSGAFPLRVEVSSPDGKVVLAEAELTLRSTAISGVGVALSIGAGLFLAVWWARHFRRNRRPTPAE